MHSLWLCTGWLLPTQLCAAACMTQTQMPCVICLSGIQGDHELVQDNFSGNIVFLVFITITLCSTSRRWQQVCSKLCYAAMSG